MGATLNETAAGEKITHETKKTGIRVDVNEEVATGHIMRCLTIAEALTAHHADVCFITADEGAVSFCAEKAFACRVMHTDWRDPEAELAVLLPLLEQEGIGTLLIDSYRATPAYCAALRDAGVRTALFDDFTETTYPVDLLINYSPGAPVETYRELYGGEAVRLLTGAAYIPLRQQFARDGKRAGEAAEKTAVQGAAYASGNGKSQKSGRRDSGNGKSQKSGRHTVFLTSGGSDPLGINAAVIRALEKEALAAGAHWDIRLLAGVYYTLPADLSGGYEPDDPAVPAPGISLALYQNVTDVARLMCGCDIGITPGSTTLYELAACGIPCISYTFADNQMPDALYFDAEGLIPYAGDFRGGTEQVSGAAEQTLHAVASGIAEKVRGMLALPEDLLREKGDALSAMIDGQGAARLAEALCDMAPVPGRKKLFLLGASALQQPMIRAARSRGLYVYALDYDPEAAAIPDADAFLEISTIDAQAVYEAALRYRPDYICTSTSDMPVRTVALVRERLSMPLDLTYENAIAATDKTVMRRRCGSAGVPVPAYYVVEDAEALRRVLPALSERFVLKPADNAASRGVVLVENPSADGGAKTVSRTIEEIFQETARYSRNGKVLAEEYMEGDEVSVEAFTLNGKTTILQITDKEITPLPYFVETGHTEPSRHPEALCAEIRSVAKAAIAATGIRNGPSHTELKLTKDGVKLVEIAARLGGDYITSRLVPLSTGVDLTGLCVDALLGKDVSAVLRAAETGEAVRRQGAAIRFLQPPPGTVKEITGVAEAERMPGVVEVCVTVRPGDQIHALHSSADRAGYVIATGTDAEEAAGRAEDALRRIRIRTDA